MGYGEGVTEKERGGCLYRGGGEFEKGTTDKRAHWRLTKLCKERKGRITKEGEQRKRGSFGRKGIEDF